MDGFCSAFIFKKYLTTAFGLPNSNFEIIPVKPTDIEHGKIDITKNDIILDLPPVSGTFFCWIDHHGSNRDAKPAIPHVIWRMAPSCTGLLCDIAQEKGVTLPASIQEFRKAIDLIDTAGYSYEEYMQCYYQPQNWQELTVLQKMHMLSSFFATGDPVLNQELFIFLLQDPLPETPLELVDRYWIWAQRFYTAHVQSFEEWRKNVDGYMYLHDNANCVVQDDRRATMKRGVPDRFYVFAKYRDAVYSLNVKIVDDKMARIGIGTNIFNRPARFVDVGALCKEVGKKFGAGSGGGHKEVGGTEVFIENIDVALDFVWERMEKS